MVQPVDDGSFIAPPAELAVLTEYAKNSMLPRIRAELSGINSLIELKDFKSLPELLSRVGFQVGKLLTLRVKELLKGQTLRSYLRGSAGHFLNWEFNLAPFISDVRAVMHVLTGIEERVRANLRAAGKVQHRHYGRVFSENLGQGSYHSTRTLFNGPDVLVVVIDRLVYVEPSRYHAEIEYHYRYSDFQAEYAQLLGLLDAFGVNLNFATIWRAIPFSFIVDWVIGVGRFLDRLKLRNMDPTINIHGFLWSVSRSRKVDCKIGRYSSNYPPNIDRWAPQTNYPLPSTVETAYRRDNLLPEVYSFETSDVSSVEFTLAAALGISRLRQKARKASRKRILRALARYI